jgi:hypothetical protein
VRHPRNEAPGKLAEWPTLNLSVATGWFTGILATMDPVAKHLTKNSNSAVISHALPQGIESSITKDS